MIVFGYYDGATHGVLEADTGDVYRFDLQGEEYNPDGLDRRTYHFHPLPSDALDRLAAAIGPYMPPNWPGWYPIWKFPDTESQAAVEKQIDAILDEAGPPQWEVVGESLWASEPFAEVRPVSIPAMKT
jgi:hypothetical protein